MSDPFEHSTVLPGRAGGGVGNVERREEGGGEGGREGAAVRRGRSLERKGVGAKDCGQKDGDRKAWEARKVRNGGGSGGGAGEEEACEGDEGVEVHPRRARRGSRRGAAGGEPGELVGEE